MMVAAQTCVGYSVLTHEEIIDLLWKQQMQPLLLARFPDATPDDLIKAHAYAYGGSVIQDVGYYPFGSHLFSDLTHYVRTGDFVKAMLDDAEDRLDRWRSAGQGDGALEAVRARLDDDLDTPSAIEAIDEKAEGGHGVGEAALLLGIAL